MEWAQGVSALGRQLVVDVERDGMQLQVHISELKDRGLPNDVSTRRSRLDIDFSEWSKVASNEYCGAFGVPNDPSMQDRHLMFSSTIGKRRFLVPALVWIRALFRPCGRMLPLVFGPHFLDNVSRVEVSQRPARAHLDTYWADFKSATRNSSSDDAVTWMRAYPSAANMAASVFSHALQGQIGIELPRGTARLVLNGRQIRDTLFVTQMSVLAVETNEEPFGIFNGTKSRFVLRGTSSENISANAIHSGDIISIPAHPDNSTDLTDNEWEALRPLFQTRKRPQLIDHRAILDGLLTKLSTAKPWKAIAYRSGNHLNAKYAFRRWTSNGTLLKTLEALRRSRM